jgi:hypothetical protein
MQATNDHRVLIGLGKAATAEKAVIRWPSGREITLENLKADQDYKLVEPKTDTAPKPASPVAKAGPAAPAEKTKPAN